ncbi:hypothetical protein B0T17DRAFT_152970 [Bombardia bombarda]|uniref:Uncharacterized protein n=1 Tax=Bombardia bombarda TaxID=252184 RepID=A0AA40C8F4_9PEZI|nr:hypothetical protein B0T17DRAFT_152970 [Bombardia bombarda]
MDLKITTQKASSSGRASESKTSSPTITPINQEASTRNNEKPRRKGGRLLNKMHKLTDWLSTAEPSSHALMQHKREKFQDAGRSQAAGVKLRSPIGQIPADAIKPATGPDPEEVALKKATERHRHKNKQSPYDSGCASGPRRPSQSSTSGLSQTTTTTTAMSIHKGSCSVPTTPRHDGLPFDGWNC